MGLDDFTDVYVEAIGSEESYGKNATTGDVSNNYFMYFHLHGIRYGRKISQGSHGH